MLTVLLGCRGVSILLAAPRAAQNPPKELPSLQFGGSAQSQGTMFFLGAVSNEEGPVASIADLEAREVPS